MKLDNFVPVGRPKSCTAIIQLMTDLDVSYNLISEQQCQNRLENKAMPLFFRLKSHVTMHRILKIYNQQ